MLMGVTIPNIAAKRKVLLWVVSSMGGGAHPYFKVVGNLCLIDPALAPFNPV